MKRAGSFDDGREGGANRRWMFVALGLAVIVVAVSAYLWFAADKLSAAFIQNATDGGSHGGTVQNTDARAPAAPMTSPTQIPAPTARADANGNLYAVPVPGKPGFVSSPYAPDAGYIDVRGFPSNTAVKDPYTGKTFVVP